MDNESSFTSPEHRVDCVISRDRETSGELRYASLADSSVGVFRSGRHVWLGGRVGTLRRRRPPSGALRTKSWLRMRSMANTVRDLREYASPVIFFESRAGSQLGSCVAGNNGVCNNWVNYYCGDIFWCATPIIRLGCKAPRTPRAASVTGLRRRRRHVRGASRFRIRFALEIRKPSHTETQLMSSPSENAAAKIAKEMMSWRAIEVEVHQTIDLRAGGPPVR